MKLEVTACNICKSVTRATQAYTVGDGEVQVVVDLCGEHAAPVRELIASGSAPAPETPRPKRPARKAPAKAAAKKAPAKAPAKKAPAKAAAKPAKARRDGQTSIMTMDEIERVKAAAAKKA